MLTSNSGDDGWAEHARSTLERDSSPLYEDQLPKAGRGNRLRHAKGWVDPRGTKAPTEEDPPLTIFRM